MSDRSWTCQFCRGSGPDPWLIEHECPDDPGVPTSAPRPFEGDVVSVLARAITRGERHRRGGVRLSLPQAKAVLATLRAIPRPAPNGEQKP